MKTIKVVGPGGALYFGKPIAATEDELVIQLDEEVTETGLRCLAFGRDRLSRMPGMVRYTGTLARAVFSVHPSSDETFSEAHHDLLAYQRTAPAVVAAAREAWRVFNLNDERWDFPGTLIDAMRALRHTLSGS